MSKVTRECNGCAEKGPDRSPGANGHHALADCTDIGGIDTGEINSAAKHQADELLEKLREANKQIVLQSQRIEELESYLNCIVRLSAKVRELELDASL